MPSFLKIFYLLVMIRIFQGNDATFIINSEIDNVIKLQLENLLHVYLNEEEPQMPKRK